MVLNQKDGITKYKWKKGVDFQWIKKDTYIF